MYYLLFIDLRLIINEKILKYIQLHILILGGEFYEVNIKSIIIKLMINNPTARENRIKSYYQKEQV